MIADAAPPDKTELYKALGLRLEYDINTNAVSAAVMATDGTLWDPSIDERLRNYGVRGPSEYLRGRKLTPPSGVIPLDPSTPVPTGPKA